jgi:hypothetical protein
MNWISLGLAVACGALAGLIAGIYARGKEDKRTQFGAAFAIVFIVLYAISRLFVFPHFDARYQARNVESELLEIAAFQAIKQYDRDAYDKLIADLEQRLASGAEEQEVVAVMRAHILKVIEQHLPRASDDAVIDYMGVMIAEMELLEKKGNDLCYRFLFPQNGSWIDPRQHFPKKLQDEDLTALAAVIKTSAEDPQPIPDEADVMDNLQSVVVELSNEHGDDIEMLQNPIAPTVNRRKICTMSADLYNTIFALQRSESGPLLRYLLAQ